MNKEIWKSIKNLEDYEVSNFGRVKSLKLGKERILKQYKNTNGYLILRLNKKTRLAHQLVAIAFLNHFPNGLKLVVYHKDFNILNNNLDNLKIITKRESTNKKNLLHSTNSTGVVFTNNKKNPYRVLFSYKRKTIAMGYFNTEQEAAEVYNQAIEKIKNGLPPKKIKKSVWINEEARLKCINKNHEKTTKAAV